MVYGVVKCRNADHYSNPVVKKPTAKPKHYFL